MRWILAAVLAAAACGGPTTKSEPIAAPAPAPAPAPVATATPEPTPEPPGGLVDEAIADLDAIANEMCTCPDTACLDKATEKLEKLSKKYATATFSDVPDEAMEQVQTIAERMADCAARITSGRRKGPKLPGEK